MALISIDTAIKLVLLLAKIEPPRGVEMLTCNRGIAIIRLGEDSFLARVVKAMAKREFPRSRSGFSRPGAQKNLTDFAPCGEMRIGTFCQDIKAL